MTAAAHIDRLAAQAARQVAKTITQKLYEKNVRVSLRDVPGGIDLRTADHGAAAEFGTPRILANPVVRTVIEKIRNGDAS
jgi:hypothetical protein